MFTASRSRPPKRECVQSSTFFFLLARNNNYNYNQMAAAGPTPEEQAASLRLQLRATEQHCDAMKSEAAAGAAEARQAHAAFSALRAESEASAALSRATLTQREHDLRELRAAHEELQERYAVDTAALKAAALEERLHLESEARHASEELKLQLQEARFQVERGANFMEQKAALEAQVDALQTQLAAEASRNLVQVTEMERRFIAEKLGMARALDVSRDAIEFNARKEATATLHESQKRVLVQNESMGSEIVHLSVQTRKLTRNLTDLGLVRGTLQRDIKDLQSEEKLWADRCARLTLRAKALEARAEAAEGAAAAAAAAGAAAQAALKARFAKETEDLRVEALSLRSQLIHRTRELASVKRLAGVVLAQRSEVEHFFLDALSLVKLEVLRRKRSAAEAAAAAAAAALVLGPVGSSKGAVAALKSSRGPPPTEQQPLDAAAVLGLTGLKRHQQYPILVPVEGVDLFDLTPQDRERVLRALFQHMQEGEGLRGGAPLQQPSGSPRAGSGDLEEGKHASGSDANVPHEPQIISRPIGVLAGARLSP